MPARKNPVVRALVVLIAIVVAVVVVMRSQNPPPTSGTRSAGSTGTDTQGDPAEWRVTVKISTLVLELDMTVPAGQGLLDAIGAGEAREGTLSAGQLAAANALRSTANVLTGPSVSCWAGQAATVTVTGASFKVAGAGPSVRDTSIDLVADVNEDGTLTVDAGFRMMQADGKFEVLAEEWGLPLGTRRSASASEDLGSGEGMFLRRRFGTVEILVLVSAEVVPPKGDDGE